MYHRLRHIGLTFLSLVMLTILPLHANAAWTSGISLSSSYSAAIPTSSGLADQESLPFRSQAAVQIDMAPLSLRIGSVTFGGELWLKYTSRSIYWGNTFYRPFWAIGPAASIHIQINDSIGLQVAGTALFCWYDPAQQAFAAIDVMVAPTFRLGSMVHNVFELTSPIRFEFRNQILAVQVGIGLRWYYNISQAMDDATQRRSR